MLQLVQLHLVVIINVTILSTYKEHQLGRIGNIVLPSFETKFYKSYIRGMDYIGLNRPVMHTRDLPHVPVFRGHSQINNI
jgi:hypothetical protein